MSLAESVAQHGVQVLLGMDLAHGGFHVVFDAAEADCVSFQQNVTGTPVAVARLTHRADVAQRLAPVESVGVAEFFGAAEVVALARALLGEDAGNVGVALKARTLHQREEPLHLALVVNVVGKDIFVEGIASGAVNEHAVGVEMGARPGGQKFPAPFAGFPWRSLAFQLFARPENGLLGHGREALGVEQRGLVVVAEQGDCEVHGQVETGAGLGSIADDVAQAIDALGAAGMNIGQYGTQGFEVAVDVAEDSDHAFLPDWIRGRSFR